MGTLLAFIAFIAFIAWIAAVDGAFDKPATNATAQTSPAQEPKPESKPEPEAKPEPKVDTYKTSAAKLHDDYEANEVATDEKIGDRPVEITGTVEGVDKDFLGNISLKLKTSNMFMPASMTLEDSEKDKAIKTNKGAKVTLVCENVSRMMGFPIGTDCTFK